MPNISIYYQTVSGAFFKGKGVRISSPTVKKKATLPFEVD